MNDKTIRDLDGNPRISKSYENYIKIWGDNNENLNPSAPKLVPLIKEKKEIFDENPF